MAKPYAQVSGLGELVKELRGTDRDIRNAVSKVNRKWTNVLRDKVKAISPRTGGTSGKGLRGRRKQAAKRSGPQHKTKPGAFKASIKSHVGVNYGSVTGGNEAAPHFIVNEFGGAVWWEKGAQGGRGTHARRNHRSSAENFKRSGGKRGHIIPVRKRSPNTSTGRIMNGYSASFPAGWFFFPTLDANAGHVFDDYWNELNHLLFAKVHGVKSM